MILAIDRVSDDRALAMIMVALGEQKGWEVPTPAPAPAVTATSPCAGL
jgi:hypothetical protein